MQFSNYLSVKRYFLRFTQNLFSGVKCFVIQVINYSLKKKKVINYGVKVVLFNPSVCPYYLFIEIAVLYNKHNLLHNTHSEIRFFYFSEIHLQGASGVEGW